MNSKAVINKDIFSWDMSGDPAIPIGYLWYEYFSQGNIVVQILDKYGPNLLW